MGEKVKLVFADGFRFEWNTKSIRQSIKVMKLPKKHGNPTEIIGNGQVANMLREKYRIYNQNPEAYKSDVLGTASDLSGMAKEDIREKIGKVKTKFGIHDE